MASPIAGTIASATSSSADPIAPGFTLMSRRRRSRSRDRRRRSARRHGNSCGRGTGYARRDEKRSWRILRVIGLHRQRSGRGNLCLFWPNADLKLTGPRSLFGLNFELGIGIDHIKILDGHIFSRLRDDGLWFWFL